MAKLLITGLSNSGKTSLLKTLENALVVSRDGKPFPLELPHFNVLEFTGMSDLLEILSQKIETYKAKIGDYPSTIVFDSVSRIFNDVEILCDSKFNGFETWNQINKHIQLLLDAISDLEAEKYNIVLIAHCTWDEKAGKYIETCKGRFAKIGGFLSTCDYAINIEVKGSKRRVNLKGHSLSRTLINDMSDTMDADEFNLQKYLNRINEVNKNVSKWTI